MKVRTKRERAIRENFKRAAVWVLLICFVASIAGLTLVTFASR
jgi:hypothetical protein